MLVQSKRKRLGVHESGVNSENSENDSQDEEIFLNENVYHCTSTESVSGSSENTEVPTVHAMFNLHSQSTEIRQTPPPTSSEYSWDLFQAKKDKVLIGRFLSKPTSPIKSRPPETKYSFPPLDEIVDQMGAIKNKVRSIRRKTDDVLMEFTSSIPTDIKNKLKKSVSSTPPPNKMVYSEKVRPCSSFQSPCAGIDFATRASRSVSEPPRIPSGSDRLISVYDSYPTIGSGLYDQFPSEFSELIPNIISKPCAITPAQKSFNQQTQTPSPEAPPTATTSTATGHKQTSPRPPPHPTVGSMMTPNDTRCAIGLNEATDASLGLHSEPNPSSSNSSAPTVPTAPSCLTPADVSRTPITIATPLPPLGATGNFSSPFCSRSPFTPKIAALAYLTLGRSQSVDVDPASGPSVDPLLSVSQSTDSANGTPIGSASSGIGRCLSDLERCPSNVSTTSNSSMYLGLSALKLGGLGLGGSAFRTGFSPNSSPIGSSFLLAPSSMDMDSEAGIDLGMALSKYSKGTFVKYSSSGTILIAKITEHCFINDIFAKVQKMGDLSGEGTVFVLLKDQSLLPMESIVSPADLTRINDEMQVKSYLLELSLNNEVGDSSASSFEGEDLETPVEIYCITQLNLFV